MATLTLHFITFKPSSQVKKVKEYVPDESKQSNYHTILFKDYELTEYIDLLELMRKQ